MRSSLQEGRSRALASKDVRAIVSAVEDVVDRSILFETQRARHDPSILQSHIDRVNYNLQNMTL